jgi:hypothetical protein
MISEAFDDVRTRLFLFGCDVSLVNRWSGPVDSSRLLDLNGEAKTASTKHSSAIMVR